MKVRMNDTAASPHGSYDRGQVYDMEDSFARKLIDGGQAVEVDDKGNPKDSASAAATETRKKAEREAADPNGPHRHLMDRDTGLPMEKVQANLAAGKTASGSQRSPSDPGAHAPATPVAPRAAGLTTQSLGAAVPGSAVPNNPGPAAPGSISAPQPSQTPVDTTAKASEGRTAPASGTQPGDAGTTAAERNHGTTKNK